MKKLLALILALVMSFSLVACGGDSSADTAVEETASELQVVIDAFNSAADAFDTTANAINEDVDAYPQELIDVMNDMADALLEVKDILENEPELTQEQIDEFVKNLNDIQAWSEEVYADLENMTIEATTVDTSYEAVVESFNYVSERFDAVTAYVNEHIDEFDETFIEGMVEIAEGMIGFKEVLESSSDLSEEDAMAILESLYMVDEWLTNEGEALIGG